MLRLDLAVNFVRNYHTEVNSRRNGNELPRAGNSPVKDVGTSAQSIYGDIPYYMYE